MDMNSHAIFSTDSNWPLIIGALTLVVGGVILIVSGLRVRRELTAGRVEFVARSTMPSLRSAARDAAMQLVRNSSLSVVQREIIRQLGRFGIHSGAAQGLFLGSRVLAVLCFGIPILVYGPSIGLLGASPILPLLVAGVAGAFAWFLPKLIVLDMIKARAVAVAAGLPDALDLLVICAEAGLALEDGIERVAVELKLSQPALADELLYTAADLKVLPNSEDALAKFAERIDLPPVRSLVTTLSQTMRYGTPLAQAMRVVAADLRNDALVNLEERANKLPALMTVPMIVLIMPTIFLILGGPAALRVYDLFTK